MLNCLLRVRVSPGYEDLELGDRPPSIETTQKPKPRKRGNETIEITVQGSKPANDELQLLFTDEGNFLCWKNLGPRLTTGTTRWVEFDPLLTAEEKKLCKDYKGLIEGVFVKDQDRK